MQSATMQPFLQPSLQSAMKKTLKQSLLPLLAASLLALSALPVAWATPGQTPHTHAHGQQHTPAQIQEDIRRHQAMAAAHQTAAECLQAGRGERVCHQQLRAACTGLALGNYCGMRHVH